MKPTSIPIRFEPAHSHNCDSVTIWFGDNTDARLMLTLDEIHRGISAMRTNYIAAYYVSDLGRDALIRTGDIMILRTRDDYNEGEVKVKAFRFNVDTLHLLTAALKLHTRSRAAAQRAVDRDVELRGVHAIGLHDRKAFTSTTRIERFRAESIPFGLPLIGAIQMATHPNVRGDRFIKTLANFMRHLDEMEKRDSLRHTLSSYLPRATMSGVDDGEFYFDGRKNPKFGMNGGIILRNGDYSTHT